MAIFHPKVLTAYRKLLIDKNMNKQDLKKATGISLAFIANLGKGENITTDITSENMQGPWLRYY